MFCRAATQFNALRNRGSRSIFTGKEPQRRAKGLCTNRRSSCEIAGLRFRRTSPPSNMKLARIPFGHLEYDIPANFLKGDLPWRGAINRRNGFSITGPDLHYVASAPATGAMEARKSRYDCAKARTGHALASRRRDCPSEGPELWRPNGNYFALFYGLAA